MTDIEAIVMPKWGLAMQEGTLTKWNVDEGAQIRPGLEICDIETSKIANAMEATIAGTLRRRVASEGVTLPVGALLAVVADAKTSESEIDAFIAKFQESFAAAAAAAEADAPRSRTVQVQGRAVNYLQVGDGGVPIVFIHGFGGDLNSWMFNQPELATGRATIALDLPGHGASAKAVEDGSVAGLAATVLGLIDALDVGRAHLVGHSLGGAIALQIALDHPARVASVTGIASAGLGPEINMGYIEGFIASSGRKEIKPHLETLFADPSLVTRDLVNDILKFKRLDGVEAALRAIATAAFAGGRQATVLRDRLGALKVPAQFIVGARDRILPPDQARGLPAAIAVHVLPDAGHMPHMEAAGEVNRLIARIAE